MPISSVKPPFFAYVNSMANKLEMFSLLVMGIWQPSSRWFLFYKHFAH